MPREERVSVGQDDRALDAVLQLADVARPAIGLQLLERPRRQGERPLLQIAAEPIHEIARENRDVSGTITQRRDRDGKDRQAEVEVLPEAPGRHGRPQALVGRRHQPHVHRQQRRAADALELLLLERAQDLGLQRHRQVPDLVEEQRPPVGHFELAGFPARGPGECALLVAEQLGLEEVLWNRGAVDRDKRGVGARAQRVQRAREEFLAGAALPFEQDGRVGAGGALK